MIVIASHVIIPVCFRAGIHLLSRICSTISINAFHFSVRNGKRWSNVLLTPNYILLLLLSFSDNTESNERSSSNSGRVSRIGISILFSKTTSLEAFLALETANFLTYIIHSGFISGYQNRYGDNLKPPTNVYHRMTA